MDCPWTGRLTKGDRVERYGAVRDAGYRENNSFTRYRAFSNPAMSSFERTNVTVPFWEELMTNLTPGPALIVRSETSDVSVSVAPSPPLTRDQLVTTIPLA
jgi:hypothetical protein